LYVFHTVEEGVLLATVGLHENGAVLLSRMEELWRSAYNHPDTKHHIAHGEFLYQNAGSFASHLEKSRPNFSNVVSH